MIRRAVLTRCSALLTAGFLLFGWTDRAEALSADDARAHVELMIDEVLTLIGAPGSTDEKAVALEAILRDRAAIAQIGRFSIGAAWRRMSETQQDAFQNVFSRFLAYAYARRFSEYKGQSMVVEDALDAGRKGVLVISRVTGSGPPLAVEWQISDRGGPVQLVDISVEGVSQAITHREEFAAMLDRHGGDIDAFIAELESLAGG